MSRRREKDPLQGIGRGELSKLPGHVFVPRGDTALTRALLELGAVRVIRRLGKRPEQIGVAALPEAIERAKAEVEESSLRREAARERGRASREKAELAYRDAFGRELRRLFPSMPDSDRDGIVPRSCEVSSRRVGRSAAAKALAEKPIRLAVLAWIRHAHTDYDARLRRAGLGQRFGRADPADRKKARRAIEPEVAATAARWSSPVVST
ncbi:DUF2293 domain-containing protein [bacterium]|nr:DUF2293 domain-containing protein [bacterium]